MVRSGIESIDEQGDEAGWFFDTTIEDYLGR